MVSCTITTLADGSVFICSSDYGIVYLYGNTFHRLVVIVFYHYYHGSRLLLQHILQLCRFIRIYRYVLAGICRVYQYIGIRHTDGYRIITLCNTKLLYHTIHGIGCSLVGYGNRHVIYCFFSAVYLFYYGYGQVANYLLQIDSSFPNLIYRHSDFHLTIFTIRNFITIRHFHCGHIGARINTYYTCLTILTGSNSLAKTAVFLPNLYINIRNNNILFSIFLYYHL